jgi:hypothetical protein
MVMYTRKGHKLSREEISAVVAEVRREGELLAVSERHGLTPSDVYRACLAEPPAPGAAPAAGSSPVGAASSGRP